MKPSFDVHLAEPKDKVINLLKIPVPLAGMAGQNRPSEIAKAKLRTARCEEKSCVSSTGNLYLVPTVIPHRKILCSELDQEI